MSEHTPGPWEYSGAYIYASGENGANICAICEPRASTFVEYTPLRIGSKDRGEAYANARLIAAAPDLYEAAKAMLLSEDMPTRGVWEWLEQAVAKAEGRENA